jgi:hypothetical protein
MMNQEDGEGYRVYEGPGYRVYEGPITIYVKYKYI